MIPEVDGGLGKAVPGQQHCGHLVVVQVESTVVVKVSEKVDIHRKLLLEQHLCYIHVSEPDCNQLRTNTQSSSFSVDEMAISFWLKQTQTC